MIFHICSGLIYGVLVPAKIWKHTFEILHWLIHMLIMNMSYIPGMPDFEMRPFEDILLETGRNCLFFVAEKHGVNYYYLSEAKSDICQ